MSIIERSLRYFTANARKIPASDRSNYYLKFETSEYSPLFDTEQTNGTVSVIEFIKLKESLQDLVKPNVTRRKVLDRFILLWIFVSIGLLVLFHCLVAWICVVAAWNMFCFLRRSLYESMVIKIQNHLSEENSTQWNARNLHWSVDVNYLSYLHLLMDCNFEQSLHTMGLSEKNSN